MRWLPRLWQWKSKEGEKIITQIGHFRFTSCWKAIFFSLLAIVLERNQLVSFNKMISFTFFREFFIFTSLSIAFFPLTMELFVYRNKLITENIFSRTQCMSIFIRPLNRIHWILIHFTQTKCIIHLKGTITFFMLPIRKKLSILYEFYHKQKTTSGFFWYIYQTV